MRRSRLSGNISEDTATKETFNPASIGTLILWYDWSRYSVGATSYTDFSGAGRTGTSNNVSCVPGANDKNVGVCPDTGYISFSSVSTRTVIRVLRALRPTLAFGWWVLSDSDNYYYHYDYPQLFDSTYAHAYAKNGSWRINGISINPTTTDISGYLTDSIVISGLNTANLSSNRLGFDRTYNVSPMVLMEDLVWSDALTSDQIKMVEKYLAKKWNISRYLYS